MNPIQKAEIWRVLHRLEAEDAEDRRTLNKPREERMLTLHPDTSRLVHIMIQSAGCKQLVEIGGAYGYSAIWHGTCCAYHRWTTNLAGDQPKVD